MGDSKFQRFIFTFTICFLMVLFMSVYNLFLAIGPSKQFFTILIKDFWLGFVIALILDIFVMTHTFKSLAFRIIEKKGIDHTIAKVLIISSCMVTGMVLCMSFYGAVKAAGFSSTALRLYPGIIVMNFIVAWPLNILIVNPLSRLIHSRVFTPVSG